MNGWKIKPYSWNHTLNLVGNLFVDEPETYGSNIVVPPDGSYTVLVNMSTTSDASKLLVGSGVTEQDKEDIADLIEQQTGSPIKTQVTEAQEQLVDVQYQTTTIEEHHIKRKKIEGDYLTIYGDNDEILAKYHLIKDEQQRIIEQIPV